MNVIRIDFDSASRPHALLSRAIHRHMEGKDSQMDLIAYTNFIRTRPQFYRAPDADTLLDMALHPTCDEEGVVERNRYHAADTLMKLTEMWPLIMSSRQIARVIRGMTAQELWPEPLMDVLDIAAYHQGSHFGEEHKPALEKLKMARPENEDMVDDLVYALDVGQAAPMNEFVARGLKPLGPDFSGSSHRTSPPQDGRAPQLRVLVRR